MKNIRVHIFVSGRVQGVGFRYSAMQQAQELGVTGWVRNTHDNKVEAVFEGDEKTVEEMAVWCKKGPPMAHVTDVEIFRQPYTGEFQFFSAKG